MTGRYSVFSFDALFPALLYDILALRAEVFVVEQHSPYLDPDGYDRQSLHLCLMDGDRLVGYTRLVPPGLKFDEASIGRIVLTASHRGNGRGRELVQRSMEEVWNRYGRVPIRIEAQYHLHAFYESFGFVTVSDLYDWGGIAHVKMVYA